MPAGRDIIDALECVLSIYFSNVRHRNRAAFLLCDELAEVTCKAKMRRSHPNAGRIHFLDLLKHGSIGLDPKVSNLGENLSKSHETRNQMQHAVAAATVDDQHCADAILHAVTAIEHCFPGSSSILSEGIKIAIRVIRLHSSKGNPRQRVDFDEEMRRFRWNTPVRRATINTLPIAVGSRPNWGHVIMSYNATIAGILDRIGAP